MARARNIKPSFFTNDELAEIEPLGRLLFIGLWTIADCNGNIEWRERRIKAQLLPYDSCDIKEIMINLDKSGFVRFYSDGESIFLNVTNFDKHQNPHKNEREKGSEIPEYCESKRQVVDLSTITINRDLSGLNHDENGTNRADSLNLIPDSPISDSPKNNVRPDGLTDAQIKEKMQTGFDYFWSTWKHCKKSLGVKNNSTPAETRKKWDKYFSAGWWKKHTAEDYASEVNKITKHAKSCHADSGEFNPHVNMMTGRFFTLKGWKE